jgi:plastocyanin
MPPHMPAVRHRAAAVLATLAALAAASTLGGSAPVRAQGGRLMLTLDDFSIAPQDVSARAGELTVTVVNRGHIGHNLHVRRYTREVASPARDVVKIPTVKPGRSVTRRIRLKPGTYTMYCSVANHEELGMYGKLVVR